MTGGSVTDASINLPDFSTAVLQLRLDWQKFYACLPRLLGAMFG